MGRLIKIRTLGKRLIILLIGIYIKKYEDDVKEQT